VSEVIISVLRKCVLLWHLNMCLMCYYKQKYDIFKYMTLMISYGTACGIYININLYL